MASWNSISLEITYQVFGWLAFFCLSFCFYLQLLLNYTRKSVVGLNFDFVVLNLMKQSCYLVYNASLFFSPVIQRQYRAKYGYGAMIPVAANDVALSIHAVLSKAIGAFQILIHERGSQKISKTCIAINSAVLVVAVICIIIAWPNNSWLWLISMFNTIQVFMTAIKYIPQAFMNFKRKSTEGWSIYYVSLELLGGVTNFAQMWVQSIDQGSFVNFYGNIGKTLLSLVAVFFDLLFIFQHYVLYPSKGVENYSIASKENMEPLMKSFGESSRVENA
ncbi:hypothetical protein MRB53_016243 [Persea americana]|uniref:Uncharacterized protein n=1 Tax=Persea americana TaxID=3435 RepID=A0ACC2M1H7_PERAE|nr:hypothetical protein MRB53_016243 [Persea americana]|eukprot:TRINITY_DN3544_c1_g1_i9.p1 TRINITY_DN3544_c1_g1~~TRINITY_DN3544_c1_g1_i9.p1  ORF type:complete len:276 (-),score=23.08 TRINITY_DN3544_c1_g1_i9:4-831(-)